MTTTDKTAKLRTLHAAAVQDAAMARDTERVAAVRFENAALDYTKAVMDLAPAERVNYLRDLMDQEARALAFRTNDRTFADTMRDGIALAIARQAAEQN